MLRRTEFRAHRCDTTGRITGVQHAFGTPRCTMCMNTTIGMPRCTTTPLPLIIGNVLRVVFVVVDPRASCHRFDVLDRRRLGLNVDDGSRRRRWGRHGTGVGRGKKTAFALLYTRNVRKV